MTAFKAGSRADRITERARNEKWKNPPLRIEMLECIDVVIVPELCSGCDKCLPACPVNCIYPFEDWQAKGSPVEWWDHAAGPDDPYL